MLLEVFLKMSFLFLSFPLILSSFFKTLSKLFVCFYSDREWKFLRVSLCYELMRDALLDVSRLYSLALD